MSFRKLSILGMAFASVVLTSGCIPEGEDSIRQEVSYVRERAYQEWKEARDRGDATVARADGPLSLDDAIRLALQYSKPLQSTVYNRDVARGQRMSDYGVVLPSFTVTAGYNRTEKLGNAMRHRDVDDYSVGLKVTQPIWQGDLIPATLRRAQLNVALVDEEIRESVQELIANVATTYYDILLAQHKVDAYKEALTSAEAQLRMVTEKKKQETATDYDVLRAQVDVATYRASMISEQNNIDSNRVKLLKLLGVSQDSDITFSDKLVFLPMRPVFERAFEVASNERADLRQYEITARVQQEAIRIARSEFFPYVAASLTQGFGKTGTYGGRDGLTRNPWNFALNASYDIGVDNWGNLKKIKAQARQAEINLLNQQDEAQMEIRQEMNNLANNEEMVKALQVNQEAAREALRLVLVGYQAGVKTEVDVTDARKALTDVQAQYYTSLTDHTKSRLNLQVAMGILGPCVVSDGTQIRPDVPIANIEEFRAHDYKPPEPITMPKAEAAKDTDGKREERRERRVRDLKGAGGKDGDVKDSPGVKGRNASARDILRDRESRTTTGTGGTRGASARDLLRERQTAPSSATVAPRAATTRTNGNGNGASAGDAKSAVLEAQKEIDELRSRARDTNKDLKDTVREAEEAIKDAKDAVNKSQTAPRPTSSLPRAKVRVKVTEVPIVTAQASAQRD